MEITEWMSSKNITLTHLHQLRIAFLTEFIIDQSNITTRNGTGCPAASKVLPLANLNSLIVEPDGPNDTLTVNIDPTKLDVGMLNLSSMAKGLFPSPLNGSNIGDIATWWQNATEQDTKDTSEFLSAVVNKCAGNFCKSGFITIGNPDIVGIGMILAIVMLLALTVAFSFLSFGPLMATVSRPSKKKRFSFREACIGTVDELFSAVFVFALAVIVSTFIFRYKTDTRFDALMANALSQLCATTVVMLAASYWAHNKQRPHATGSVFVVTVLTIAMFATHAPVANMHASAAELACGIGRGRISTIRGDPFDMKKFHFVPVGFGTFLLALFGACFHHPWVHSHRPTKEKGSLMLWRILWATAQSLPSVMGLIGLVIYTTYFLNTWEMMKETYGATFSKNIKNWGFGQLLAIFTWLPPLLSFMHLFWGGMEVSLEKRLPQGWKVVRVQNDSDGGNGEHMTRTRVRQVSGSDGETYSLLSWRSRKKPTNTTPQTNYHQFPMRSETGFSNAGLLNAQTENQSHQAAHQSPEVGYDNAQVLFQNPVAQVYQVQSPEVGYQDLSPEVGHQAQNHEDEYHVQSPEVQYPSQGYHSHYHYHNQNYQNSGYPDAEYPPTPADAPGYYRPNR